MLPWIFLTVRDRARRLVGVRGAGLGRLLGLGPGRERVVPAVADRHGGAALGDPDRAQGHPQGLDRDAGAGHLPAHDPRHLHDALRRLQLGPLLHAERDRPHDPRVPGRSRSCSRWRCSRCASTASRPKGRIEAGARPRRRCSCVNNLLFVLFTFTVLLGTVFPLVVEAVRGVQMSVGRPYFDRMAVPIGVALLFLMGVGPGAALGPRQRRAGAQRAAAAARRRRAARGAGLRRSACASRGRSLTLAFGGYTAQVTLLRAVAAGAAADAGARRGRGPGARRGGPAPRAPPLRRLRRARRRGRW